MVVSSRVARDCRRNLHCNLRGGACPLSTYVLPPMVRILTESVSRPRHQYLQSRSWVPFIMAMNAQGHRRILQNPPAALLKGCPNQQTRLQQLRLPISPSKATHVHRWNLLFNPMRCDQPVGDAVVSPLLLDRCATIGHGSAGCLQTASVVQEVHIPTFV